MMKKNLATCLFIAVTLTNSSCTSQSPQQSESTNKNPQPSQAVLATYGFQYGTVNHLSSVHAFDQAIASGAQIFVKVGASWCPPCQKLAPIITQLAPEFNSVLFIEVNFDSFKELANRYGIRSIPAVLLFKNGTKISQTFGFQDKSALANLIRSSFTV
jgi:thioredoxin 1